MTMTVAKKAPKKAAAKKAAKKSTALTATAGEMVIHPLLAELPIMDAVVNRLADDAKKAKGGQFDDKKELHADNAITWAAFVADIKLRGIIEPIVVVPAEKGGKHKWVIVDGRHRFTAGGEAGLEKFPIKVTKEDPAAYILGALCQRNHYNKQQRAFFALHLHPHLIDDQSGKRVDLEEQPPESFGRFANRLALAQAIGVSDDTINIAAKVHSLFVKAPAARKKYLPLIFAGVSLKGILTGNAAANSSHGKGDERNIPWVKAKAKWSREAKLIAAEWQEVERATAEEQAEVMEAFSGFLTALPPALQEHAKHILTETTTATD